MFLRFALNPELTDELRQRIVDLWVEVTNAGGAVGFVPPVTTAQVAPVARDAFAGIADGPDDLLVGYDADGPAALLILTANRFRLKAHWRVVKRVMVHPRRQGRGDGAALMREAERIARAAGWQALHVTVRGGHGLEKFYERCGYREVGRLPGALRVAEDDDRDEILMWLPLAG